MKPGSTLIKKLYQNRLKDGVAFYYFKNGLRTATYGDFFSTSETLAAYIQKNLKKGSKVALLSENRYEWCATYLAALLAGTTTVPIDPHLGVDEIRAIVTDSETSMIFVSGTTVKHAEEAIRGLDVKLMDFDSDEFMAIRTEELSFSPEESFDDDIATLVYTSGTTGMPKAVMLSHGNLASDIEAVIDSGIITHDDILLSILPLHHTYALMCTFLVPVSIGAKVTYPPSLKGPDILEAMRMTKVSILIGVPRIVESLLISIKERLGRLPINLLLSMSSHLRRRWDINVGRVIFFPIHRAFGRNLKYIASGGARLDPNVMKEMEALGFTVIEGYGLTETSPVVTFNPPKKRKPGSVGKPLGSVEIKIINPSDTGEGEIVIRGPMVMKGYYKNPALTAESIKDGWLLTGDLGYLDSGGYLYITGRLKDVIVLPTGKNIYPEDVERHYGKIPLIKEICVFSRGDRLEAVVVPDFEYLKKHGIGNINEALRWEINAASRRLPPHMRLMGYTLHTEPLPKTPLGKFRRFMIKDLVEGQRPAPKEDKTLTADETAIRVLKCLKPLLERPQPVQAGDNLEIDLGIDSLKRIELVVALEKEFSVTLPEGFASEVQTVGELIMRIKKASAEESRLRAQPKFFRHLPFEGPLREIFRLFIKWFLKIFYGFEVKGIENLPKDTAFIIAPNHSSYLDGFVVAAALPKDVYRKIYFQGFQRYFRGIFTAFFAKLAHVILIDPDMFLSGALETSKTLLKEGNCLVIFPEGGRTFDGTLMPFKKGIGMLALSLNIPVVPAYISGTYEILPRDAKWLRPRSTLKTGRLRIIFGAPIMPEKVDLREKPEDIDDYQHFANLLREKVRQLSLNKAP